MKLSEYIRKNGIQQKWFASQIGINYSLLSKAMRGHAQVPKKYWKKIIKLTKGEVTLEDLYECSEEKA